MKPSTRSASCGSTPADVEIDRLTWQSVSGFCPPLESVVDQAFLNLPKAFLKLASLPRDVDHFTKDVLRSGCGADKLQGWAVMLACRAAASHDDVLACKATDSVKTALHQHRNTHYTSRLQDTIRELVDRIRQKIKDNGKVPLSQNACRLILDSTLYKPESKFDDEAKRIYSALALGTITVAAPEPITTKTIVAAVNLGRSLDGSSNSSKDEHTLVGQSDEVTGASVVADELETAEARDSRGIMTPLPLLSAHRRSLSAPPPSVGSHGSTTMKELCDDDEIASNEEESFSARRRSTSAPGSPVRPANNRNLTDADVDAIANRLTPVLDRNLSATERVGGLVDTRANSLEKLVNVCHLDVKQTIGRLEDAITSVGADVSGLKFRAERAACKLNDAEATDQRLYEHAALSADMLAAARQEVLTLKQAQVEAQCLYEQAKSQLKEKEEERLQCKRQLAKMRCEAQRHQQPPPPPKPSASRAHQPKVQTQRPIPSTSSSRANEKASARTPVCPIKPLAMRTADRAAERFQKAQMLHEDCGETSMNHDAPLPVWSRDSQLTTGIVEQQGRATAHFGPISGETKLNTIFGDSCDKEEP